MRGNLPGKGRMVWQWVSRVEKAMGKVGGVMARMVERVGHAVGQVCCRVRRSNPIGAKCLYK